MLIGAEIGMFIYGLVALFRGKFSAGADKTVTGGRARVLGVICMIPIPLALMAGVVFAILNPNHDFTKKNWGLVGAEAGIVVVIMIVTYGLAHMFYNQQRDEDYE